MKQIIMPDEDEMGLGGIWITDYLNAQKVQKIQKKKITNVLSVICNSDDTITSKYNANGIKHRFIQIDMSTDMYDVLQESIDWISQITATSNILIHDMKGNNQAAMIVIGYLMKHHDKSYHDMVLFFQTKDCEVNLQDNCKEAIMKWEKELGH